MCSRYISNSKDLNRHIAKCEVETKHIYVGGTYKVKKTLFECLDEIDIKVPAEDRYDEYFTVFDFEALQVHENKEEHGQET